MEWIKIYIGYRNMNEMEYYGWDWEFGLIKAAEECVPYVKAKNTRHAVEMKTDRQTGGRNVFEQ
jgi:hypothetical protein